MLVFFLGQCIEPVHAELVRGVRSKTSTCPGLPPQDSGPSLFYRYPGFIQHYYQKGPFGTLNGDPFGLWLSLRDKFPVLVASQVSRGHEGPSRFRQRRIHPSRVTVKVAAHQIGGDNWNRLFGFGFHSKRQTWQVP